MTSRHHNRGSMRLLLTQAALWALTCGIALAMAFALRQEGRDVVALVLLLVAVGAGVMAWRSVRQSRRRRSRAPGRHAAR